MSKLTKNQKLALSKIEAGKAYTLAEAVEKVKEVPPRLPEQIMLVSTNILKKSRVVGLMLTLSSHSLPSWVR